MNGNLKQGLANGEALLSMLHKKDISGLMMDIFDEFVDSIPLKANEESVIQHTSLSYIRGYLLAHVNSPDPTPIMLAGAIMDSVGRETDRIMEEMGDTVLEKSDE